MNKKIVVFLMLCFWFNANAQENWTLKQCIDYGLKNNRNNNIYLNQKRAADAKAREVIADYLPQVSLTSSLDNNLKLQQTVIPAGVFGDEERRVSLSKQYNMNTVVQVDQVLYDQSLIIGIKANKYNKQQAELNIHQSQEAIIYNIGIAYFQIFVYHQQLELLNFNKATYEKQIGIYRLQVDKGIVLQKDLDKVSVDYNNTISQIRVAQSNLQLAENELKYEMGYPITDTLVVDLLMNTELPVLTQKPFVEFSPTSRIDYQLSELKIKALETEQSRIKAEALPKLSTHFRYGGIGLGDNLNGSFKDIMPYSAVGIKLTIPIFNFYKRNARYKQAQINHINAKEDLLLSEGKYRVEYENAYTKLLEAQANMENDRRNIALAESVLEITDLQFQKGTTNLTDWLNTQNSLKEAQNSYLNSSYSYYRARIDLEKAAGTLKFFYNSL